MSSVEFQDFGVPIFRVLVRNEKAAQKLSFGAGYPADVHADIPADVRGQKFWSGT